MYEEQMSQPEAGGILAAFGAALVVYLLIFLFIGFCYGKLFQKAGRPLWAGFVPIYNLIVLLEIVGRPLWWIVLMLIPFVNVVVLIITSIDLAKSFGKTTGYGIGLLLLGIIFLPMLAFGDARYVGPAASQNGSVNPA